MNRPLLSTIRSLRKSSPSSSPSHAHASITTSSPFPPGSANSPSPKPALPSSHPPAIQRARPPQVVIVRHASGTPYTEEKKRREREEGLIGLFRDGGVARSAKIVLVIAAGVAGAAESVFWWRVVCEKFGGRDGGEGEEE